MCVLADHEGTEIGIHRGWIAEDVLARATTICDSVRSTYSLMDSLTEIPWPYIRNAFIAAVGAERLAAHAHK